MAEQEALAIKCCPLCWRYRPLRALEEVLIREARPVPEGKVRKLDLAEEGREAAGLVPGRERQVWWRCADGVCRERHP